MSSDRSFGQICLVAVVLGKYCMSSDSSFGPICLVTVVLVLYVYSDHSFGQKRQHLFARSLFAMGSDDL